MPASLLGLIPLIGVLLFDMQNVLSWSRRRVLEVTERGCEDYTILVPLYGHPRYFAAREQISRYKDRVLLVCELSAPAMVQGADDLEREGWNVLRLVSKGGPTAPKLMLAALESGRVTTTYVARLDADTDPGLGFAQAVESVRKDGSDLASLKVHVLDPHTLCEKLQAQEYRMSMLSRHFRPRLTSGAGYIAKTDALRTIFRRHTGVFFSEDVETGRIAWQYRMRIRHVDYEIRTTAPPTWRSLWKQRTSWWAGNVHHFWINLDHNMLNMPVWTLYYVVLVWAGLTWKWQNFASVFTSPLRAAVFFAVLWALYVAMTYISNWQVRSRYMLIFPFYSIVQVMLMPPVGLFFYIRFTIRSRQMWRYRFGYRRMHYIPEATHA